MYKLCDYLKVIFLKINDQKLATERFETKMSDRK